MMVYDSGTILSEVSGSTVIAPMGVHTCTEHSGVQEARHGDFTAGWRSKSAARNIVCRVQHIKMASHRHNQPVRPTPRIAVWGSSASGFEAPLNEPVRVELKAVAVTQKCCTRQT